MAEKKAKRAVLLRKGGKDTAVSSEGLAGKARKAAEEGKTSFRGGFLGLGKKYNIVPGKTSSSKSSPSVRASSKKSTTRPKARPATLSGVSFGGAKATNANKSKSDASFAGIKATQDSGSSKPTTRGGKTYSGRGSGPGGPMTKSDRAKASLQRKRATGDTSETRDEGKARRTLRREGTLSKTSNAGKSKRYPSKG